MKPIHVLAIDQGTTSSRAIVFDRKLTIAGIAQREFTQHFPHPGWVEHDAEEIWKSVVATCRGAIRKAGLKATDIAAIGRDLLAQDPRRLEGNDGPGEHRRGPVCHSADARRSPAGYAGSRFPAAARITGNNLIGHRAHRPDPASRKQVEAMAGYGVPEAEIAGVIGIDPKTVRKHYRQELDFGHTKTNARVAENLFRKATGEGREAVTATIFWLKTRAGWKQTTVQEHAGAVTINLPADVALGL